jgi:tetratricopeptide (TPR) repeat protein
MKVMSENQVKDLSNSIKQAYRLIGENNLFDAIKLGNDLVKRFSGDPRSWNLLCEINRERGALTNAVRCAEQATRLAPDIPNYQIQYGRCLVMAGRRAEALAIVDQVIRLNPRQAALLDAIGSIYSLADEQTKALPFYQRAVKLKPDNSDFNYNLSACLRMNGHLTSAEESCDRVLELYPHHYEACYIRADLKKWTVDNNHIPQMEQLLSEGVRELRGEIFVRFALAKEAEDIADYEKSFQFRASACELQRKSMQYRVEDDVETIDRLIEVHTREAISNVDVDMTCSSKEPIFIVGLPRSGTTLVERIVGSHSAVYSAGELNEFAYALMGNSKKQFAGQKMSKMGLVDRSLTLNLKQLGESYIQSTRPRTGHTPYFIDKLPLNYLYCGLIHAAIPNAKIILLQRNPMDVCYAVYKTLFTSPYPFSYDLKEVGSYYLAYRRLMDHWKSTLGELMLTVDYEQLVYSQEEQSRRIIEYCGLPWEDVCLDFQNNKSASSTASSVQVRQPIYTSSIGQWRNYQQQLEPLVELFEENGVSIE